MHLCEWKRDIDHYLRLRRVGASVHLLHDALAADRLNPSIDDDLHQLIAMNSDRLAYYHRPNVQERLKERLLDIMATHRLDAFVFPHQQRLAVKIGETQGDRNGVSASVTGFPSITIPAGFSAPSTTAPLGVPIGIEFIGRPWSEQTLITLAGALEQVRPVRKAPIL
jgi:Asp-tRNA(Asn)/Glu-tRNA(Gln) amidotransferase A subunit family amidase